MPSECLPNPIYGWLLGFVVVFRTRMVYRDPRHPGLSEHIDIELLIDARGHLARELGAHALSECPPLGLGCDVGRVI